MRAQFLTTAWKLRFFVTLIVTLFMINRTCAQDVIINSDPVTWGWFDAYPNTTVNGNLTITGGVPDLEELGDDFWENLSNVTGSLIIDNADNLTSLNGLQHLLNIGGDLIIQNCDNLEDLTGLENLQTIGGELSIINNNSITTMGATPWSLQTVGSVFIGHNISLTGLDPFQNITSTGAIEIRQNPNLVSIISFPNLVSCTELKIISNGSTLNNVQGFENVNTINYLEINNNPILSVCCWATHLIDKATAPTAILANAPGCESVAVVNAPPIVAPCPANQTISVDAGLCSKTVVLTDPFISDNCDLVPSSYMVDITRPGSFETIPGSPGATLTFAYPVGVSTVKWYVKDTNGQETTCTTVITVVDDTPPEWDETNLVKVVEIECGEMTIAEALIANTPTATDDCTVADVDIDESIAGTTGCGLEEMRYIFKATNGSGIVNPNSYELTIRIIDTTGPVLTGVPADETISCNDAVPSFPTITALDACDGDLTSQIMISEDMEADLCGLDQISKIITRSATVTDACGNPTIVEWKIMIVSDSNPFSYNSDTYCLDDSDPSPMISSLVSGTFSASPAGLIIDGASGKIDLSGSSAGTYTVSYNTSCSCPDVGTFAITIDPQPTATISGATTVCQGATAPSVTFTGAGGTAPYTFTYSVNGTNATVSTTGSSTIATVSQSTMTAGSYSYTLESVSDANGCMQTQMGSAVITVDPSPTASISGPTSVCGNSVDPTIMITGSGGTAPYTFIYTVNDGDEIMMTTAAGSSSVSIDQPTTTTTSGKFTYTLVSVTDANGCMEQQIGSSRPLPQEFVVTVDNTAPVAPTAPAAIMVQCAGDVPALADLTATDNLDGDISVMPSDEITPGSSPNEFMIVRTWTFTDDCDNTSSISQTITVNDQTAPMIQGAASAIDVLCDDSDDTCPFDAYQTIAELESAANVIVSDNCSADQALSLAFIDNVVAASCSGSSNYQPERQVIRTYTVSDQNGNSNMIDQQINMSFSACNALTDFGVVGFDDDLSINVPSGCTPPMIKEISPVMGSSSGYVEYMWLISTEERSPGVPYIATTLNLGSVWFVIDGQNEPTLSPAAVTQNTYYIRCSRDISCCDFGESNIIGAIIDPTASCPVIVDPTVEEDCDDQIVLLSPTDDMITGANKVYRTDQSIEAEILIMGNSALMFDAKKGTTLQSNAEVATGSTLEITLDGCDE